MIQQEQNLVYLRGSIMGVLIEGRGILHDRELSLQLINSMGVAGEAQAQISADNRLIRGFITVAYQGTYPLELFR